MDFIGRNSELALLEEQYVREHSLTVIKGRRRVGKSALIREFIRGKNALFFEVNRETPKMILRSFSAAVSAAIGGPPMMFSGWEDAVKAYLELGPKGHKVIAIDEFPYICTADKEFPKTFQALWDTLLSVSDVMVIICGSFRSMMDSLTDDYDSPLYGRNTCDLVLMPLSFRDTYSGGDYRKAVESYAFTGGVPHYMQLMDGKRTVMADIEALTMGLGAPLLNEPAYLMSQEYRDPSSYNSYLRAIASGNRSMNRLSSDVDAPAQHIIPYLERLQVSGMIEKRVPLVPTGDMFRRTQYVIADYFTAYWFLFVYPYYNELVRGETDAAVSNLRASYLDRHVSFVFEDICRQELRRYLRSKDVAASYGQFWKDGVEIDVVALDRKKNTVYLGECKYRRSPVDMDVMNGLVSKGEQLSEFRTSARKYCLFSVSGYTDNVVREAEERGILLFDRGEIVGTGGRRAHR